MANCFDVSNKKYDEYTVGHNIVRHDLTHTLVSWLVRRLALKVLGSCYSLYSKLKKGYLLNKKCFMTLWFELWHFVMTMDFTPWPIV